MKFVRYNMVSLLKTHYFTALPLIAVSIITIVPLFTGCNARTPLPVIIAETHDTIVRVVADNDTIALPEIPIPAVLDANYRQSSAGTVPNVLKIANINLYISELTQSLFDSLALNGFYLDGDSLTSFADFYRRNDSLGLPSFVTADAVYNLVCRYDTFVRQAVDEQILAPLLADVCLLLHRASLRQAAKEKGYAAAAGRNALFMAVPYTMLTGKHIKMDDDDRALLDMELAYIDQATDRNSPLGTSNAAFPYSKLQPVGYYSQSATLRRYFKAVTWLQTVSFNLGNDMQRQQMVLLASLLSSDKILFYKYNKILNNIVFLNGSPVGTPVGELATWMQTEKFGKLAEAVRKTDRTKKDVCFIPPTIEADSGLQRLLAAVRRDTLLRRIEAASPSICVEPDTSFWNGLVARMSQRESRLRYLQSMTPAIKLRTDNITAFLTALSATADNQAAHRLSDTALQVSLANFGSRLATLQKSLNVQPQNANLSKGQVSQGAMPLGKTYIVVEYAGRLFLTTGAVQTVVE